MAKEAPPPMIELSGIQWMAVANILAFAVVALFSLTIYLLISQSRVLFRFRNSISVSVSLTINATIFAGLILRSYVNASHGNSVSVGFANGSFNGTLRLGEWLIGIPLQIIVILSILSISRSRKRQILQKLIPATLLMIILGFFAAINADKGLRFMIAGLAILPFLYVLTFLLRNFTEPLNHELPDISWGFKTLRKLLIMTWSAYPIIFLIQISQDSIAGSAGVFVGTQTALSLLDVITKGGITLIILSIARSQSEAEGAPE